MNNNTDEDMMHRCIELARKAEGRTSPNPMVGAVILDSSGEIVGEGFHQRAGEPHAEVFAFDSAGARARGGTLYVNLEPCSHFGKTPPCADRVVASGVKRVVIGMQDPNPKVLGGGIAKLKEAGIEVEFSTLEKECQDLNRAFVKRIKTGLPWVALKIASTLDGRIADRDGKSRWITGPEARKFVHELRNKFDCVLVGSGTALQDDPELNVRESTSPNPRDPHKALIDSSLRVDPSSRIFRQGENSLAKTYVFCSGDLSKNKMLGAKVRLYPPGVEVISNVESDTGSVDLRNALKQLGSRGIQTVLCEGGAKLAASLLEGNLVDEVIWFIAPKLLVDSKAISALNGEVLRGMDKIIEGCNPTYTQCGNDMLLHFRIL